MKKVGRPPSGSMSFEEIGRELRMSGQEAERIFYNAMHKLQRRFRRDAGQILIWAERQRTAEVNGRG